MPRRVALVIAFAMIGSLLGLSPVLAHSVEHEEELAESLARVSDVPRVQQVIGNEPVSKNFELVGHDPLFSRGMNAALAVRGDYVYVGNRTDGSPQHRNPGILVVDVSDPSAPEVVHEIGPPAAGNVGVTTREMRVWPEQDLLMVLNFGCSSLIHACTGGETQGSSFTFFDISGEKAAAPELISTYEPSKTPHEFFLWVDPERPAERAFIYWSGPDSGDDADDANMVVTDISKAREGEFTEVAKWIAEFPAGETDRGNTEDRRLHSFGISNDGTRASLAFLGSGFLELDTSEVVEGAAEPEITTLTPPENRASWTNPGAHSAVKLFGRDVALVTDEVYGDALDALGPHGCPWGWVRMIDVSDPRTPEVIGEYRTEYNTQEYCDSAEGQDPTNTTFTSYSAHNPTNLPELSFITWHSVGLEAISTADPTAPANVGRFDPEPLPLVATEDPALNLGQDKTTMWSYPIIQDGLIYVTDIRNGLYILRYTGPGSESVDEIGFLEGNSNLGDALRLEPVAEEEPAAAPTPSQLPSEQPSERPSPPPSAGPEQTEPEQTEPEQPAEIERVAGASRLETAADVSRRTYPDGSDTVVLARADTYPDALAGGPLAFREGAPILLSSSEELSAEAAAEIDRLGATRAIVLGGADALSEDVESALTDRTSVTEVERVAGSDRYATAVAIARRLGGEGAFLTKGGDADANQGWADALAVAPVAAHTGRPILLTGTEQLADATRGHLSGIEQLTIVGGEAAVSAEVAQQAREAGAASVDRVGGATRYETAVEVAGVGQEVGLGPASTWIATGTDFADALVSGPAVAREGGGGLLFLTDPEDLDDAPATRDYLAASADEIERVTIIGGTAAVSERVRDQIATVLSAG